jgi:FkbM family methyltransferase
MKNMNKIATYFRYFQDYLKHGDMLSIVSSIKYLLFKTSHRNDRIIKTSIGTFFCRKNTNDFQFANFGYEWGVKKFLLTHHADFDVFIDGGACVGDYSILMSRKGLKCFAFEPIKDNFRVLSKNLELNQLAGTIKALNYGLGMKNGTVGFKFNPVNTGASSKATDVEISDCHGEIRTFDSILPELNLNINDRILFKLDVEGMEAEAILGAAGFIRNYPNITFVLEDKHTGQDPIQVALSEISDFEFGIVDDFNIFAKKRNR